MSQERWLITALSTTVVIFLSLITALSYSLQWDWLAITTLDFLLAYPLIWSAWRIYGFWCLSIRDITSYTQVLKEGEQNLHFKKQHPDNLLFALQQEITSLVVAHQNKLHQNQSLDHLLSRMLDAWSVPICLFDEQLKLTYRNDAMNDKLQQPMLLGSSAEQLGFKLVNGAMYHTKFDTFWQNQTIHYSSPTAQKHWLFSAFDVSHVLQQKQTLTQQNLIRVLSHELRNSLTPMSSMTDTLLTLDKLDDKQTRLVLSRIHQRSERLLAFISEYSKLAQLPQPKMQWFNFKDAINEAKSMMDEKKCHVDFQGNEQCFADINQIIQVLINIFKNALEATEKSNIRIEIKAYYQQNQQIIELYDDGPGFANLNNVLTPFYTTKQHGSGIGLSLCTEIIRNHGGQLIVENRQENSDITGAKILMCWPTI
jgi:two-component system nitrogen regulation sensor histidine kinase NtrY